MKNRLNVDMTESTKYMMCSSCKLEYPEGSKFCRECGSQLVELQREVVEEASNTGLSAIKKFKLGSLKSLRGKKTWLVGGIVAGVYLLGSTAAYFFDNPQGELQSMVSAIKSKDVGQLGNKSLFPNPEGLPLPTDAYLNALKTNQSKASIQLDWEPGFSTARAEVVYENGEKFEVSFTSSLGFWGPFIGRSWQVDAEPTVFSMNVVEAVPGSLPLKIGEKKFELSAFTPEGKRKVEFLTFPGSLILVTEEAGIYGSGTIKTDAALNKKTTLELNESQLPIAKIASATARSAADSFVDKCVKRECASLPYIDIDWSPSSPGYFYDYRSRTDTYTKGSCTVDRWQATSATSARVVYSCEIFLSATELQVTYYYYFSDDYEYYFGYGSGKMKIEVDVSANADGKGFKAGKVRTTN